MLHQLNTRQAYSEPSNVCCSFNPAALGLRPDDHAVSPGKANEKLKKTTKNTHTKKEEDVRLVVLKKTNEAKCSGVLPTSY